MRVRRPLQAELFIPVKYRLQRYFKPEISSSHCETYMQREQQGKECEQRERDRANGLIHNL